MALNRVNAHLDNVLIPYSDLFSCLASIYLWTLEGKMSSHFCLVSRLCAVKILQTHSSDLSSKASCLQCCLNSQEDMLASTT